MQGQGGWTIAEERAVAADLKRRAERKAEIERREAKIAAELWEQEAWNEYLLDVAESRLDES